MNDLAAAFMEWKQSKQDEFDRAAGEYNLRGDIRRDHPDLRDTLPQYDPPEIMKWDESPMNLPAKKSVPKQIGDSLVGSATDMLMHPVATASMITALPLGFVKAKKTTSADLPSGHYDNIWRGLL